MSSNAYSDSFKEILRIKYGDSSAQSYSDWICENTRLKYKPYSFKDHEYQMAPVNDPARILVLEKSAQLGFTECFFRWILCFLIKHQSSQAIFTQPTDGDIGKFVKSRADIILEECPIVKKLGTGGVDSVQLKRIGSSFLNFRGTFGARAAISVPSDANNYDEVNFSNPRVLNQYKSRLQHSDYKYERYISTPTIPNFGVSELYNRSDRKRINLKCNHCGHNQFLDWPKNIFFKKHGSPVIIPYSVDLMELYVEKEYEYKTYIGCEKCSLEVDRSWGWREWVQEFPERNSDPDSGISGYHLSRMDADHQSAMDLVRASDRRLDGYKTEQDFMNFAMASPFEGGDAVPITDACKSTAIFQSAMPNNAQGTYIGLDLGAICHLVVIKDIFLPSNPGSGPVPILLAAYRIPKEALEERLPQLIQQYGALYTVSDAQPYTITVENIAKTFPNRMSICYFGGKKTYSMSSDLIQVTANRTATLDELTNAVPKGKFLIASKIPDFDILWTHFKHLAKTLVKDDDGEPEYYDYVKIGDDHYGYAAAYAMLARKIFLEVKPTSGINCGPVNITGAKVIL